MLARAGFIICTFGKYWRPCTLKTLHLKKHLKALHPKGVGDGELWGTAPQDQLNLKEKGENFNTFGNILV